MAAVNVSLENLGSSVNYFTSNIYQELAASKPNGNFFLSPFSITAVLSMVYLGADGNTAKQLEDVLAISPCPELYKGMAISNSASSLLSSFWITTILSMLYHCANSNPAKKLEDAPSNPTLCKNGIHAAYQEYLNILDSSSNNFTLRSANRLYANQKFTVSNDYKSGLTRFYLSTIESVDFDKKADQVKEDINGWVEQYTNNKIKDLIPDNELDASTLLVLVNAIYFKGTWAVEFPKDATSKQPFYLNSSRQIEHDMMRLTDKFLLKTDAKRGLTILELPYTGKSLSMMIVLPDETDGLSSLEEQLNPEFFHDLIDAEGFKKERVQVELPKFRLESSFELNDVLARMGLSDLFDKVKCNLSKMFSNDIGLYVSKAIHKAFVDVSEEGTEAAAATAVIGVLRSSHVRIEPPIEFKADHPFMFSIVDKRSKTVLFVGRVDNPKN